MAFNIILYQNGDEPNRVNKILGTGLTLTGTLRDESSVVTPEILVAAEDISDYNYAHIPTFGRYYFITDIVSVRTGLWRISLKTDVLMSFKTDILNLPVILANSETTGGSNYLSGNQWQTNVKYSTIIKPFSTGFNDTGEYILIVAGG